jgi:hypothetical protein
MKLMHTEILLDHKDISQTDDWKDVIDNIHKGILQVQWPKNSGHFLIYPEPGKDRGKGNGVKPIKDAMMIHLNELGWKLEEALDIAKVVRPGKLDAVKYTNHGPVALEWETGNISSTHRAINKMALGLLKQKLIGGILILPTRKLYRYLTDRVGNWDEIAPYLDLWKSLSGVRGNLQIIVVEHDDISYNVPRINKGTDGRALV